MPAFQALAVFDLDGTLLDTLDDLHAAVNHALAHAALPLRTREEVRQFVGNGVERLVRLSVPAGTAETDLQAILADFKRIYAEICEVSTAPYPGVLTMLDELRDAGIGIAVVSNKFDTATKQLCARYFGERVTIAIGERETDGVRKKPAPDTVFEALAAFGIDRDTLAAGLASDSLRVVYIGDSDVDIETARNAGIPCISVTWGFRDADFLRAHGATRLVHTTAELTHSLTDR